MLIVKPHHKWWSYKPYDNQCFIHYKSFKLNIEKAKMRKNTGVFVGMMGKLLPHLRIKDISNDVNRLNFC